MKDLFEKFFKQKYMLGCDVGVSSVKFVNLKKDKDVISLESLGLIEAEVLGDNSAVGVQRVKAYFKEHGLAGNRAGVNIEDKSLRIRRMDLPEMPASDLKIAIRWNLREYVDGPIEKYTVNFSDFGGMKVNGDRRPVLAFGVATESVDKLLTMVKQTGIKPISIEPNATAMLAAFDANYSWDKDKHHVLIDMGSTVSNFIVVGNGLLLFSRPIQGAGSETLKKTIARELSVSIDKAEGYLKQLTKNGKVQEEAGAKLPELVSNFMSQMVIDVQRSIDAFCIMFHADKVEDIYLSGGGSLLPGICEYITKNLGVSTQLLDPFKKIDTSVVNGKVANGQLYTLAVGLALPK